MTKIGESFASFASLFSARKEGKHDDEDDDECFSSLPREEGLYEKESFTSLRVSSFE